MVRRMECNGHKVKMENDTDEEPKVAEEETRPYFKEANTPRRNACRGRSLQCTNTIHE
jgi:hypothetical protein